MKTTFNRNLISAIALALSLLPASCVTSFDLKEAASHVAETSRGPKPESVWNSLGIWQRVADHPPTYIPVGYARTAPRDEKHGQWIEDSRDGKRLFVPNIPVGGYEPSVLLGEAKKVTRWDARTYATTVPGIMILP